MTETATTPETTTPTTSDAPAVAAVAPEVTPAAAEPAAPDYAGLKLAEGYTVENDGIARLVKVATENKVPLDRLQAHIDQFIAADQKFLADENARHEAALKAWTDELKADKDIGGAKYDENMAHAKKWVETFGGPELTKLLDETGLGSHPLLVRALVKAGREAAEAPLVGSGISSAAAVDATRIMYPKSPMLWQQ